MKKHIVMILFLSLLLTGCAYKPMPILQPTEPTAGQGTESPTTLPTNPPATDVPTEEPTEAPTEGKILLELQHFDLDESIAEGTEAETETASIVLEDLALPETALKPYENEEYLAPVAAVLETELGLTLDSRWQYYIHYYTQEQDVGILAMTYWIDGNIATNRAITVPIENGTATTVIYSYLDRTADEAALLQKYEDFRDTHVQQRDNLLGEDFEIYGESTLYTYNFRTDALKYTYNIFYRHIDTGIIDNSYGTEVVIE